MKFPHEELVVWAFTFGFSAAGFALSPATIQRIMTAKNADVVKTSIRGIGFFTILVMLPMIIVGATAAAVLADADFDPLRRFMGDGGAGCDDWSCCAADLRFSRAAASSDVSFAIIASFSCVRSANCNCSRSFCALSEVTVASRSAMDSCSC